MLAALSLLASPLMAQQPSPATMHIDMTPPKDAPPVVSAPQGPYAVTIESETNLPTHTVYRPSILAPFTGSTALPIIAWGNGGCSNAGLAFKEFLSTIVSYGFVVIVAGPKDAPLPDFAGGPQPTQAAADPAGIPEAKAKDADLITAIDWAVAENARGGSPFYRHLNPHKIAVMGQSCGGLMAIAASADPRVKTSIIWNSGTFPEGSTMSLALSSATKASLKAVHAPIAYINGGPTDVAYPNSVADVDLIHQTPVFFAWASVGHGGTYRHPGGGRFAPVGVAWLEWRLNGDKTAAKQFQGRDCGLCKDPAWHVVRND